MSQPRLNITRRQFITGLAASGGSVYAAMLGLGLLEKPAAEMPLPQGQVEEKRDSYSGQSAPS